MEASHYGIVAFVVGLPGQDRHCYFLSADDPRSSACGSGPRVSEPGRGKKAERARSGFMVDQIDSTNLQRSIDTPTITTNFAVETVREYNFKQYQRSIMEDIER